MSFIITPYTITPPALPENARIHPVSAAKGLDTSTSPSLLPSSAMTTSLSRSGQDRGLVSTRKLVWPQKHGGCFCPNVQDFAYTVRAFSTMLACFWLLTTLCPGHNRLCRPRSREGVFWGRPIWHQVSGCTMAGNDDGFYQEAAFLMGMTADVLRHRVSTNVAAFKVPVSHKPCSDLSIQ